MLPDAAVTFQVTATRAERARLVFTGSGTEMVWNAQVVAEDRTAGDGLRRTWHPDHGVFGSLGIQVVGPGGVASKDLGQVSSSSATSSPSRESPVAARGRHRSPARLQQR